MFEEDEKEAVTNGGAGNVSPTEIDPDVEEGDIEDDEEGSEESDADSPDEPLVDEERERPASRGEKRFQKLSNELASERAAREKSEKDFREAMSRLENIERRQVSETPEQREQRFALLTPVERVQEELKETRQQMSSQMQQMQFQSADASDRSSFETLCVVNPVFAKVKDEVESRLKSMRAQGGNLPREALAKYLIGESVIAKGGEAGQKHRAAGQRNINRQQGRPVNSRGDVSTQRSRSPKTAKERLEGVTF